MPPMMSADSAPASAEVLVFPDAQAACLAAAAWLAEVIERARQERGRAVLGLPTGSTPKAVYAELVRRYGEGLLSFEDVTTYNLDEYYPVSPLDVRSYHAYMDENLFRHVDLAPHCAHVLDGTVPEEFAGAHAADFDRWIDHDGGLDVQLLGIGRNGHIAFNEPSDLAVEEAIELKSRLVDLHPITRADAAKELGGMEHVIPPRTDHGLRPDPGRALDRRPGHRRPQSADRGSGAAWPHQCQEPGLPAPHRRSQSDLAPRRGRGNGVGLNARDTAWTRAHGLAKVT